MNKENSKADLRVAILVGFVISGIIIFVIELLI